MVFFVEVALSALVNQKSAPGAVPFGGGLIPPIRAQERRQQATICCSRARLPVPPDAKFSPVDTGLPSLALISPTITTSDVADL